MTVMILFFAYRDVSAENLELTDDLSPDGYAEMEAGIASSGEISGLGGYLCIPLQEGIGEDNISISSDSLKGRTEISIQGTDRDFYYKNPLTGSRTDISSLAYGYEDGTAHINIAADGVREPDIVVRNSRLYIKMVTLKEKHGHVFVIDAGHGGEDKGTVAYGIEEKKITLGVLDEFMKNAVSSDNAAYFYTRTDDSDVSEDERTALINAVQPDAVISIHANADSRTRITNGAQVLSNRYASGKAAAGLLKLLTESTGMAEAEGDTVRPEIMEADSTPVYVAELGYMTDKAEAVKMSGSDFMKEAARAIRSFITDQLETGAYESD